MRFPGVLLLLLSVLHLSAQDIKVEYDKNRDFTKYKTFSFGESEITTPKDQKQVTDAVVDKWITDAITRELEGKGLARVDSAADLVVTYAAGTAARSDYEVVGPLGQTPGAMPTQSYTRDYRQGSFVIDLNDRSSNLIWRINSVTNASTLDGKRVIDQVVAAGFKKFSTKPKKEKKKK